MSAAEETDVRGFRDAVFTYYKTQGRHTLPWRKTRDSYRILVSEVMLQQTQVERVIPYYEAWMKKFPTVESLARAPLADVITLWQGLGYNRRAKMLHDAAKKLVNEGGGGFQISPGALERLPGIGPYTARAVAAFAHNDDVVFVETNIRTAVITHFFPGKKTVSDKQILEVLEKAHPRGKARDWYSALMDYGAHLKKDGVRLNTAVKGYKKQTMFAGSPRQARGAILKALVEGPRSEKTLLNLLGPARKVQLKGQIQALMKEGMIEQGADGYHLPR